MEERALASSSPNELVSVLEGALIHPGEFLRNYRR